MDVLAKLKPYLVVDRSEIIFNRSTLAFILYLTTGQSQFEFASEIRIAYAHIHTLGIISFKKKSRHNDKDVVVSLLLYNTPLLA